jgi:hypothetical protein
MEKSQSSIEFIILIGAVMFFLLAFFVLMQGNIADKTQEKQNLLVQEIAETIQNEINMASNSNNGYQREFIVQDSLENEEYELNIVEEMIYVRTIDGKHAIALPIPAVQGNIKKGVNEINKQNDTIYLNE